MLVNVLKDSYLEQKLINKTMHNEKELMSFFIHSP
jgi:hypothetical protein